MSREGHLDEIYRLFWYLKKADPSRIIFDSSRMDVDDIGKSRKLKPGHIQEIVQLIR